MFSLMSHLYRTLCMISSSTYKIELVYIYFNILNILNFKMHIIINILILLFIFSSISKLSSLEIITEIQFYSAKN